MASTPVFDVTPPTCSPHADQEATCAQRSSRSKFRNFFTRRKLSPSPDVTNHVRTPDEHDNILSARGLGLSPQHHLYVDSKPALASRAHSETSVPQRKPLHANNQTRSRDSNRVHTKALSYIDLRACLRSTIRTPIRDTIRSSTTENTPSRSRCSSSHASTVDLSENSHLYAATSAVAEKLFILGEGATILQYEITGHSDRLPERIIQLTSHSLAIPIDATFGKGAVLEVTTGIDTVDLSRPKTNRATWSRNPFRGSTAKRSSDSLLMIFDDVDLMSMWMAAIRKEIGGLGDSLPRPYSAWSTADKPPALRSASTERFSLRQSFLQISRSSSSLRHDFSEALNTKEQTLSPVPPPPPPSSFPRSSTARSRAPSSTGTATSLDRLRESDSNSTTTAATNSLDGSVVLDSPVKETFANLASPTSSLDSRSNAFSEAFSQRSISGTQPTLQERRNLIVSQLRLMSNVNSVSSTNNAIPSQDNEKQGQNPRPSVDEAGEATSEAKKARPVSILPPLPSPDDIRRPPRPHRTHSTDCLGALDQPTIVRPASSYEGHRSKLSTDAAGKSMYSLFPKKRVEAVKSEPLVVPETNHIPGLSQNHATDHLILPPTPTVAITPAVSPASTKLSSKKPSPLKLLAPFEIEQAQRSPAVTDDMLATNFGVQCARALPSPLSPTTSNVPTFDDLKFDFSFLKHDFSNMDRRRSNSPPNESGDGGIRRLKSTPSLRVSRAPTAPVGPPPTGPLPAVPPEDMLRSNPSSPVVRASREQRRSNRSDSSLSSSLARQRSPRQSLNNATSSTRSSSAPQPEMPAEASSPLAPVGMPSIISPPPSATKAHDRQKSSNQSITSVTNHKRAKSSGKYSLSISMKNFPAAPMLCDKPSSFYCS